MRRRLRQPEVVFVAVLCAALTVAIGIYPEPLFDVARDAGDALRRWSEASLAADSVRCSVAWRIASRISRGRVF